MKTTKLLLAATLALAVLGGLIWVLAWRQPTTAKAQASAEDVVAAPLAPQTLPMPWLSDDDVADAPFDNPPAPTVDGYISPGEYAGAGKVTFPGYGGYYHEVEVFFKQDGITLYVAFELPDETNAAPYASLFLDTNNDKAGAPQPDDFEFRVARDGSVWEYQGDGSTWGQNFAITWTYGLTETMTGWSVEFGIPFTKLGITPGTFKVTGLALGNLAAGPPHFWPTGAISNQPSTWGSLVSSSDWSTFYWKPGPWEDYAPSGMPDFDQHQDNWIHPFSPISTHCGPVAMANSLWWFDSKFETPDHPPSTHVSDTYRLVTTYDTADPPWDDHDPQNVIPFVDDLANKYFNTNDVQGTGAWMGTYVTDMHSGTLAYLRDHGLWDDYIVTLVEQPDFKWVADEVQRSEDVILLLGFWEWVDPDGIPGSGDEYWARVGGHYVTVAGVDPAGQIAFSDPFVDAAEMGLAWGRILSGTLIPHQPIPGHTPDVHNDAGNISHDVYPMVPTNSPGGTWGPGEYPWWEFIPWLRIGVVNPHPYFEPALYMDGEVYVEVEFALAVSPHTWKSSGEWLPEDEDPVQGAWQPWIDYAINGVPDFDEKQDSWGMGGTPPPWTYCGPVAAANSLWWFDSKFEPSPVGPLMPPYQPMPYNDNYPMVWSYDAAGAWDDHDPQNVETGIPSPLPPPPVPWPPFSTAPPGEFVDELAAYFDTDDQSPPFGPTLRWGTVITDMYNGIDRYLWDRVDPLNPGPPLRQGYVITQVKSPEFWWVAEEVEHSEDVILLLGFYEWKEMEERWVRLGGHYVTAPGVDKQGGFIAFSDPYYDGAGFNWPYAYPTGWPTVMGRVADGWLTPHPPWGHASTVHNDAGNISHDVYYVVATDSPGGVWGPRGYVESWDGTFEYQNGGGESYGGGEIQTEVDWAVAVSPVADVWVAKGFDPTTVTPGDWITLTIRFRNDGSLLAEDVVITDTLPSELVNTSWSHWTSNGLAVTARPATTYVWDLPDLKWTEWGVITVTAQVDPSLSWPLAMNTITNTVKIGTSSLEQYQIPEQPNVATATLTIQTPDVAITKAVTPTGALENSDWLTFTLIYSNAGPATASGVVITDVVPSGLTSISYTSSGAAIVETGSFSYTWQVADLAAGQGGIITITAQITNTWPLTHTLVNTATISALFDHDPSNNQAAVLVPLTGPTVYLPLVLRNY